MRKKKEEVPGMKLLQLYDKAHELFNKAENHYQESKRIYNMGKEAQKEADELAGLKFDGDEGGAKCGTKNVNHFSKLLKRRKQAKERKEIMEKVAKKNGGAKAKVPKKKAPEKKAPNKPTAKAPEKKAPAIKNGGNKKAAPSLLFIFASLNGKAKGEFTIPKWEGSLTPKAVKLIEDTLNKGLDVTLIIGSEE